MKTAWVRPSRRTWVLVGLALAVVCFLDALPAFADEAPGNVLEEDAVQWLPMLRWDEGIGSFHTHSSFSLFGGDVNITGLATSTAKSAFAGTLMSFSQALWSLALTLVVNSISIDPIRKVGGQADALAGKLASAVTGGSGAATGGFLVLVVVLLMFWGLWNLRKAGSGMFAKALAVRALAVVMILLFVHPIGANRIGSASWYVNSINNAANTLSVPVLAATGWVDEQAKSADAEKTGGFDCSGMLEVLHEQYRASASAGSTGVKQGANAAAALSSMWESSMLDVWKQLQVGQTKHAERAWCHILERAASGVSTNEAARVMHRVAVKHGVGDLFKFDPNEVKRWKADDGQEKSARSTPPVFLWKSGERATDVAAVGWAACTWNGSRWDLDEDLTNDKKTYEKDDKAQELCNIWFSGTANREGNPDAEGNRYETGKWNEDTDPLHFSDTDQVNDIRDPDAANFVNVLQGRTATGGVGLALVLLVASLMMFFAFGLLALAVFIAKIFLLVNAVLLPVTLLMTIMPGTDTWSKMGNIARSMAGYGILGALATFLLSVLVLLTQMVNLVVEGMLDGGVLQVFLTGASPLFAIWMLGSALKKAGLPNPMSIKGAVAWGQSAGALGRNASRGGGGGAAMGAAAGGGAGLAAGAAMADRKLKGMAGQLASRTAGNMLGESGSDLLKGRLMKHSAGKGAGGGGGGAAARKSLRNQIRSADKMSRGELKKLRGSAEFKASPEAHKAGFGMGGRFLGSKTAKVAKGLAGAAVAAPAGALRAATMMSRARNAVKRDGLKGAIAGSQAMARTRATAAAFRAAHRKGATEADKENWNRIRQARKASRQAKWDAVKIPALHPILAYSAHRARQKAAGENFMANPKAYTAKALKKTGSLAAKGVVGAGAVSLAAATGPVGWGALTGAAYLKRTRDYFSDADEAVRDYADRRFEEHEEAKKMREQADAGYAREKGAQQARDEAGGGPDSLSGAGPRPRAERHGMGGGGARPAHTRDDLNGSLPPGPQPKTGPAGR